MLTFKNIQDQVLAMYDQSGDTGNTLTIVKNAINIAHQKRLMEDQWNFMLWANPVTLNFVTGVRNYTIHPLMGMMSKFINTTAKQYMHETPSRARYKVEAIEDRYHFEFVQTSPVKLPSVVGVVSVVGGGAGAVISYVDINGNYNTETVAAGASTTFSVDTVVGVSSTDLTKTLSLTDAANVNMLSLVVGESGKQFPQIRLFDDGVSTETSIYTFYRIPRVLVNDNDVPDIPFPYSNVCIYDTLLELATYNDGAPQPYWLKQQDDWDLHMRQAFQEGEMAQSEARVFNQTDLYEG